MGKTSCKPAVVLFPAALTLAGGVGGWLYYRYVGCAAGAAPLRPTRSSPSASVSPSGCCSGCSCVRTAEGCRAAEGAEQTDSSRKEETP